MRLLRPHCLEELSSAFEQLDAGEDVALLAPDSQLRPDAPPAAGSVGVTSSGSTGVPRMVWHLWKTFRAGAAQRPEISGWNWAAPYNPSSFAGAHVALQAWIGHGAAFSLIGEWKKIWATLNRERIDAISATPTFLDLLLQTESGSPEWHPRQVTIGGEPLRPATGARLAARFPRSRFTAIYATAELGVLALSHRVDGWYEVGSLVRRWPEWRITGGILEVRHCSAWQSTGDTVDLRGDLLRVIGRARDVANVAGTKINLAEVSYLAEQVPGVLRAVALAEPSAVTGQIVFLKFAVDPHCEPERVTGELQEHLRAHLRKEAWPRRWQLDDVAPFNNAKRIVGNATATDPIG